EMDIVSTYKILISMIRNDRTEGNIRKVILSSFKKAQRPHLTGDVQSRKRDEQLADLFATRLGYGRPLVTALTHGGGYENDSA
ncbi:hypothetical protein, partial [Klebsiella pneumoniae]|uniref:hypothetical protein n=1 Tax=Klebsiella pneumoniae TaxID=573 RepID=UPI00396A2BA3